MKREEVSALIEEIGIFPGIRVKSGDQALYAAETLYHAGIPVAEITMTVPGGIEVIRELAQNFPGYGGGRRNSPRSGDSGALSRRRSPFSHQHRPRSRSG